MQPSRRAASIRRRLPRTVAAIVCGLAVQLLLADGALATTFGPTTNYSVSPGGGPRSVAARDFDADGDVDLATANQNTPGSNVSILINNGSGGFAPGGTYNLGGSGPVGIVAGRFNSGSDIDLAVSNGNSGNVTVLFGAAGSAFTISGTTYNVGSSPRLLAVTRLNTDPVDDLVVAVGNANKLSVLLGSVSGQFTTPTPSAFTVVPAGSSTFQPHGIAAGDFNNDGNNDVATANYTPTGEVSVLLGNGTGTLGTPTTYAAGSFPIDIKAEDVNNDANVDLVVANHTTAGLVTLLPGNGNGTFGAGIPFTVPTANATDKPAALVVSTFGHGSARDLAVAMGGPGGNEVAIMCGAGAGTGNGSFSVCGPAAGHVRPAGSFPFGIAAARLEANANMDVAVANLNSSDVSVVLS